MSIEYTLSPKDFQIIAERAYREFLDRSTKKHNSYKGFLAECFIDAFIKFCHGNDLEIRNGKIYKICKETD